MLARRTFIVRVHAETREPIVEDVNSGERVRLPNLDSIGAEIKRRVEQRESYTPTTSGRDDCVTTPP